MPLGADDVRLDGRVAIVTGAAVGIGRATAIALARFGADVAICDRDAGNLGTCADEIEAAGRTALLGILDVRDGDQVATWLREVATRFTHVDVLVNNAGGGFRAAFLDVALRRKWVTRDLDSRALGLTRAGRRELQSRFDLEFEG